MPANFQTSLGFIALQTQQAQLAAQQQAQMQREAQDREASQQGFDNSVRLMDNQLTREGQRFEQDLETAKLAGDVAGQTGKEAPKFANPRLAQAAGLAGEAAFARLKEMEAERTFKRDQLLATFGNKEALVRIQERGRSDRAFGKNETTLEAARIAHPNRWLPQSKQDEIDIRSAGATRVNTSLFGDRSPLTRGNQTDINKRIMELDNQIPKLEELARNPDIDEFHTYGGQVKLWGYKKKEKGGVASKEDKDYIARGTNLKLGVEQLFNDYRHAITGAAAALAELDQLKESYLSGDMSPTELRTALSLNLRHAKEELARARDAAQNGVPLGDSGVSDEDRALLETVKRLRQEAGEQ